MSKAAGQERRTQQAEGWRRLLAPPVYTVIAAVGAKAAVGVKVAGVPSAMSRALAAAERRPARLVATT
jgi:hypothetical protein